MDTIDNLNCKDCFYYKQIGNGWNAVLALVLINAAKAHIAVKLFWNGFNNLRR